MTVSQTLTKLQCADGSVEEIRDTIAHGRGLHAIVRAMSYHSHDCGVQSYAAQALEMLMRNGIAATVFTFVHADGVTEANVHLCAKVGAEQVLANAPSASQCSGAMSAATHGLHLMRKQR